MRAIALGMSVSVVMACRSSSTTTTRIAPPPAATPVDSGGDDRPLVTQWDRVRRQYGRLSAVAGRGATDRGNEWRAAFEGGAAVDAELSRPHFAMADAAGNVYIADKEAHAVREVSPSGVMTTVAGTGATGPVNDTPGPGLQRTLGNPNGLFVLPDGTLYILDLDHSRVRKLSPGGVMSTLFQVPGGIAIGRGLWVSGDEREVLVASGTDIVRWTPGQAPVAWARGFASLGMVVRIGDAVFAADRGADHVVAIAADGSQRVVAGGGVSTMDGSPATELRLEGVRAVWPAHPDDGGGFFVGTHDGCQVWFVDAAGDAHLFLDGASRAHAGDGDWFDTPGPKLSELRSLTLDARGDLLVVENDRGFVRRVERLPAPR